MTNNHIGTSTAISKDAVLEGNVSVWDFSQIREDAFIGENVIIGRNVYIGVGVKIGANSKIQNNALIYEPAIIESGVFIGPGVILTNDRNPRAINPDLSQKNKSDWISTGVHVLQGAAIGAGVICISPVRIGRWAFIAAGSVVTNDVADFALVMGTPARQVGWVGKSGMKLIENESGTFTCPVSSQTYSMREGKLIEN